MIRGTKLRKILEQKSHSHQGTGKAKQRYTWRGTFERTGKKHGKSHGATLVLIKVHQKGSPKIIDHAWLNYGLQFAKLNELYTGDIIEFTANIKSYYKGGIKSTIGKKALRLYQTKQISYDTMKELQTASKEIDYELTFPERVKMIKPVHVRKGWQRQELSWMNQTQLNRFAKFWTVKHQAYEQHQPNTFD